MTNSGQTICAWFSGPEWRDTVELRIVRYADKKVHALTVRDGGRIEWVPQIENAEVPPVFVAPRFDADSFLGALARALNDYGIAGFSDGAATAELKATKYHLEDMRKLLKIPPRP